MRLSVRPGKAFDGHRPSRWVRPVLSGLCCALLCVLPAGCGAGDTVKSSSGSSLQAGTASSAPVSSAPASPEEDTAASESGTPQSVQPASAVLSAYLPGSWVYRNDSECNVYCVLSVDSEEGGAYPAQMEFFDVDSGESAAEAVAGSFAPAAGLSDDEGLSWALRFTPEDGTDPTDYLLTDQTLADGNRIALLEPAVLDETDGGWELTAETPPPCPLDALETFSPSGLYFRRASGEQNTAKPLCGQTFTAKWWGIEYESWGSFLLLDDCAMDAGTGLYVNDVHECAAYTYNMAVQQAVQWIEGEVYQITTDADGIVLSVDYPDAYTGDGEPAAGTAEDAVGLAGLKELGNVAEIAEALQNGMMLADVGSSKTVEGHNCRLFALQVDEGDIVRTQKYYGWCPDDGSVYRYDVLTDTWSEVTG